MAEVGDSGPCASQCAWCRAVRLDGEYRRCPAIPLLNRLSDNVTHGICPSCKADHLAELGRVGKVAV